MNKSLAFLSAFLLISYGIIAQHNQNFKQIKSEITLSNIQSVAATGQKVKVRLCCECNECDCEFCQTSLKNIRLNPNRTERIFKAKGSAIEIFLETDDGSLKSLGRFNLTGENLDINLSNLE